jgi:SpoVK/Ycf46/Vps4 family AAA+-type ATPase
LQTYVENCTAEYERHMMNKLGTHKYFFNMMTQSKNKSGIQNALPTSHIIFTKHKFVTSRTFDNVFFEQRQNVRDHTEFFLNRKDWYDAKGIPHTLGFMFHGDPGCGKTSTIKAIANVGKRHIINIHLSEIKSKEQLTHLFFNDEITVLDNGKTERYTIPVSERMYVIEDIDAMGDIVLRRELKKPEAKKEIKMDEFGNIREDDSNPIDLSFILNLLDGTLESAGRIIAISTNFPERIDRALIRPGRIDMIIHFKKCSIEILREMVESFYDKKFDEVWDPVLNEKWTPAEINQILFRNFKNSSVALTEIKNLTPNDLYGFNPAPSYTA